MLNAIDSLEIKSAADTLFAVLKDPNQPSANRAAALRALDKLKDPRIPEAVKIASDLNAPLMRQAALPISARLSPEAAAPVLANLIAESPDAGAEPWKQILTLMAESWMSEVENSFSRQAGVPRRGGGRRRAVPRAR